VRNEAFKAALNLQVAGGGVRTLRFVLQSIHADVRREVLTEVMAQAQEPWAWNLVLEFYNDADARLREEAFQFAIRKNKELPPLETALLSQYADVRRMAVDALIKKHSQPAQALLAKSLSDPDKGVRQRALEALVSEDAVNLLTEALRNEHADIRVKAARALARHGVTASLAPLLALATAPEPKEKERQADWLSLAESAIDGIAELGDSSALAPLVPLLKSDQASLRKAAARALAWVALPHQTETLRQALQNSDAQVKYNAALGLAYAGDPLVGSLVFSKEASQVLSKDEQLVAAFTLGPAGEDQLAVFLDDADEGLRTRALLLLMLLEMKVPQGAPARCLACLAARPPRVRLTAARALENFADPAAFRAFVVQLINDRGDEPAWKITDKTVDSLAELLSHGGPATRARSAQLLRHLAEKEAGAWEQAWKLLSRRYAAEIDAARKASQQHAAPPSHYTPEQLRELAFGAYVGLVRGQVGATDRTPESTVARVRQTALSRLQALATSDPRYNAAARPVFVQALGDPNKDVRMQAFDQLVALGMDGDTLGAAALGAGHTDIGVRGLEALAGGGDTPEGQAVLEEAMKTRLDDLATEAAKLLIARRGPVPVAALALAASHEPLRKQAVDWLAAEYDKSAAARDGLRQALTSRHRKVVTAAALELAAKKDSAAYDALVKLLGEIKDAAPQKRLIEGLQTLGNPRTPGALLDRIENDPDGTAQVDALFETAGSFRRPETADRLLQMAGNEKWTNKALAAIHVISGFEQPNDDPEDEKPDRSWEKKQHPRHTAVLARLMQRCLDLKQTGLLGTCVAEGRWAREPDVDPVFAQLAVHSDENLRKSTVEAIGWRLRKRKGPADPLLKGLQHRDPNTQFLAAEGLARAGRTEGLGLLLSAVDLQENTEYRRRAIEALGIVGDVRALDLLLKIVNDPTHALQDEAAEALGHMGRSAKADEVQRLLEQLARGDGKIAQKALRGLRWLDHPDGWQIIRKRASEPHYLIQETAVELLGYHDDPATRDLLLKLLATTGANDVFEAAMAGARRLWGNDSLEPDYAAIQNRQGVIDDTDALFKRLKEKGDAKRLLEILPKLDEDTSAEVKAILLARRPLPIAEAQAVVAGPDAAAAGVAAHLLGRAGPEAASAAKAVGAALARWWTEWDRRRQDEVRRGLNPGLTAGELANPLQALMWAAGRLDVGADTLVAIATTRSDMPYDRPVRREAVAALAFGKLTKPVLTALEALAVGDDAEVRAMAAEAVARADAARGTALAAKELSDRVTFNRVAARKGVNVTDTLRAAVVQVHNQGIAVPQLVSRGDVAGLAAVAGNRGFTEDTRLGAVEGLSAMANEDAEKELVKIGQSLEQPEELRKAAWRGLRRSKRARKKATAPASAGT
jgi:ParB family chromosome partitioning protein